MTTQVLTQEIGQMRKLIEDMHITASEKDAEIIRLKMHLGDEKAKSRMRQTSQASLLNHSSKETGSAVKPNNVQGSLNELYLPRERTLAKKSPSDFYEL